MKRSKTKIHFLNVENSQFSDIDDKPYDEQIKAIYAESKLRKF